ncbi:SpoIIE family protein phosphatase [Georgenia thermotolerans]|uniref:SpoIIE family protein phosphatase n=1 Tax=Georgenia thermotolerans TaxID=527326 RepID=A0A7J5UU27_9MICO|nr:SpoIIE family protein phosphatase [Georgenia thermotolerans]KAE8765795.1 SpoIIE family protein phosphatase [Georgenia thermotolerans]
MSVDREHAWDEAPTALLTLDRDGTVVDANATFLEWVGRARADVVGRARLSQLLSVGGRIYWETHLAPMLHADGRAEEVALELRGPDGRLPVLLTAVVTPFPAPPGTAPVVQVALSSARERSRYERELLAARRAAEDAAGRTRVLQEVTSALSGAVGVAGVVQALLDAATTRLGAAAATFWRWDRSAGPVAYATSGEEPGDAPPPAVDPGLRMATADGERVVVPAHGQSRLRGLLSLAPRRDPGMDPLDLDFLTAVGQQAGLALDRAQMFERHAAVAHELQRSLLATTVPQDPRFDVATSYRPGVETLEVGGDFYDAFLVDDDVLAVVVGDVVGRGLPAASAMGQLRSAVRAVAGPDVGPAALVSRLDRFVHQVPAAASATLAYAEVRLSTGHVRLACAGHLPPVLLPARGAPGLVWEGRSTPLGLVLPSGRSEAELRLEPGDRVLLYTDGLVERRHQSLRDGLGVLVGRAAAAGALAPAEAVQTLTDGFLQDQRGHDDVCVLLLTWHGEGGAPTAAPTAG